MSITNPIKEWCKCGSFSVLCVGVTLVMTPIIGSMVGLIWVLGEMGVLIK